MAIIHFKLSVSKHNNQIQPSMLEFNGEFVPVKEIAMDWATEYSGGVMTLKIPMHYVDIILEEDGDALPTQPEEQEASAEAEE